MLPTTPAIAREGAEKYLTMTKLARREISPRLGPLLYLSEQLPTCFVGTTPEVTIDRRTLSSELLAQSDPVSSQGAERILDGWENLMNTRIPGFAAIRNDQQIHVINMLAVGQIMTNYPEYFTGITPINFLSWFKKHVTNPDLTEKEQIQYGLISGFTLHSVLQYKNYLNGVEKLSEQQPDLLYDYIQTIQHEFLETEVTRQQIFAQISDLTPDQKNALLQVRRYNRVYAPQFASFSSEDGNYIEKLGEIYESSGIRESFKEIRADLRQNLPDIIT